MQNNHEFSIGDQVEWSHGSAPLNARRGTFKIVRQMPENASGDLQYRIKSGSEVSERVVREHEITRVRFAS